MEKLILIDGNSLVNRAYYALPPLNTQSGEQVNAVYGFATMLIRGITDIKPDYIAVAFDLRAPTFRHLAFKDYKATRKGMPENLASQMPILKKMLGVMGIKCLEYSGFEADDIIGTMAKRNKVMTYIITGDQDSLQLIDDSTSVLLTRKGISEMEEMNIETLKDTKFLSSLQVIEYKALAGDSSDNIPGVPGVGEKTATTLLEKYGDIDGVYAHLDELAGKLKDKLLLGKESANISKMLATIKTDMEIDCPLSACKFVYPFTPLVKEFFKEMNFKSILKRDDIFSELSENSLNKQKKSSAQVENIVTIDQLKQTLVSVDKIMAFYLGENSESIHFSFDLVTEYVISLSYSLIDSGLDFMQVMAEFKEVFANKKIVKIVFDAKKIKWQLLKNFKLNFECFFDVKLAQYLTDMTAPYSTITEMLGHYMIIEADIATGLIFMHSELEKELEKLKMHRLYYDVELPLVDILFGMEVEGFRVDTKKLNELGEKYSLETERLAKLIYDEAGQEFNIKSPKQLAKVLFEDMKIPYPKKGSTYSTGVEILELIQLDNPIISLILQYRFVTKLNSTYIEGIRKLVDSKGIVHTEFRQMLTTTGRLSSAEPNLQNIPIREEEGHALRAIFVAREGRTLVSADYSQIELRLMAHFSGDPIMVSAYKNNEDIHTQTASQVFGVEPSDVTSKMRRDAKAVNFGIIYGISDYGLANNLKISRAQSKQYIESYFQHFPGVKKYLESAVEASKKTGTVETILGRVRKIPELFSSNYMTRQFGERAAMNMPLQGSAADIIKIAMVNVSKALEGKKSKLILQIHDELIVDTDLSEIDEVKSILKSSMENAAQLNVPLKVEIGVGKNWLEC